MSGSDETAEETRRLAEKRAFARLAERVGDARPDVRAEAAISLGRSGQDRGALAALDEQEILREVVASRVDWWVRGLALKRLAQLEGSAGISGEFYNGLRPAKANAQAYDDKARERLHVLSMRLTSLAP